MRYRCIPVFHPCGQLLGWEQPDAVPCFNRPSFLFLKEPIYCCLPRQRFRQFYGSGSMWFGSGSSGDSHPLALDFVDVVSFLDYSSLFEAELPVSAFMGCNSQGWVHYNA